MPTYSRADFDGIGAAIGKDGAEVMKYADRFESAARWYRTVHRAPERVALSVMRKKMTQIANAARKLLRHLDVYDYRKAPDGTLRSWNSSQETELRRTTSSKRQPPSDASWRFSMLSMPFKLSSMLLAKPSTMLSASAD